MDRLFSAPVQLVVLLPQRALAHLSAPNLRLLFDGGGLTYFGSQVVYFLLGLLALLRPELIDSKVPDVKFLTVLCEAVQDLSHLLVLAGVDSPSVPIQNIDQIDILVERRRRIGQLQPRLLVELIFIQLASVNLGMSLIFF